MMRSIFALAFLGVSLLALACGGASNVAVNTNTSASKKIASDADVPRISPADAKKEVDAGNAVIVDSRNAGTYEQEHIAGSINIPFGAEADVSKLPKGKKIIVYCS